MRSNRIRDKPLQALGRVGKVAILFQVNVTQMGANETHGEYAP
jgi:hypothetical protein